MSLNVEGVCIQALARAHEVTDHVPVTRALMYRRVGLRQQELFSETAKVNHEYYGCSATAPLADGLADLATIADPVPVPEAISRIEITDPGDSDYLAGDEIHPVTIDDPLAAIAPRVTIRNRLLRQVETDLDGVVSITIYYSRRPEIYCPDDACAIVELRSPWDELLVIDLAKYILNKCPHIDAGRRTQALQMLADEETGLLRDYFAHVRDYVPFETRLTDPPAGNTPKPASAA